MNLRIGSRGSVLAKRQARIVMDRMARTGCRATHHIITTRGDLAQDLPLHRIDSTGLFVREIEMALLRGEIDCAVHSLKDMPAIIADGLSIAAVLERDDPRDALVSGGQDLGALPPGARVGTSSLRRRAQLARHRPDLEIADIRGNVDSRLAKHDAGEFDAIVLAACGLDRIGLSLRIVERISTEVMLPAACQGIIAIETRSGDDRVIELVRPIGDPVTMLAAETERSFLAAIEGGCRVPVGCLADIDGGRFEATGLLASVDGSRIVRMRVSGAIGDREELGRRLAFDILDHGGRELLEAVRERPES